MSKRKFFTPICIVLLFAVIFFALSFTNVICIRSTKNPSERYYSSMGYDDGFVISYTHSVNKGRIHDYYAINKRTGELFLDSTFFVSYGAGIPEPEEIPGAVFQVTDNGYIIKNIDRPIPQLSMAVGLVADHTFSINYSADMYGNVIEEVPLTDLFTPQTSIILEIKRVNFIEYLLHKLY